MRNAVGQRSSKLKDGMRRQRASEARLHQILSLMPAAVYTCDASGRITFFNRRAMALWGREPEINAEDWKFCGSYKLFRDGVLLRPDRVPMADALRERKSFRNVEAVIERPDGSRSQVLISIDPVFDDDGRFNGAINVFQDTTDRKAAEEALHRLAAIVESSHDAIISKDLEGVIRSWNKAAERMFGYQAAEAIGQPVTILIPPERHREEQEILACIRRGERVETYETVRRRKDGELIDLRIAVSPLCDALGTIIGASKIARDITTRKSAERTIQALSTPVLEVYERMLVLPLIGGFDAERSRQLTAQLLASIRQHRARVVVLDLTGMATIDEPVANHLRQTVLAARLLGAEVIFSGISRQVAQILTTIGFTPGEVTTVSNLRAGIEAAERLLGRATARPLAVPVPAR